MNRRPVRFCSVSSCVALAALAFAAAAPTCLGQAPGEMTPEERAAQRDASFAKGVEMARQGELKGGLVEIDRALQMDPGFAPGYLAKGEAFRALKEYSRAVQAYTVSPSNCIMHSLQALALMQENRIARVGSLLMRTQRRPSSTD